jgi:hypothetical protein
VRPVRRLPGTGQFGSWLSGMAGLLAFSVCGVTVVFRPTPPPRRSGATDTTPVGEAPPETRTHHRYRLGDVRVSVLLGPRNAAARILKDARGDPVVAEATTAGAISEPCRRPSRGRVDGSPLLLTGSVGSVRTAR